MISFDNKIGIFKEQEYQAEFDQNGYVILPLLDEEQIRSLKLLYEKCYPEGVNGFFSTTFANNVEHREEVNRSIKKLCKENIDQIFSNYKILFSSFIVKAPGKDSELIMHQDMTLVDEKIYSGINIWCPLIDLNEKNGAIRVLKSSHRFFHTYRGSSLPDIYDDVKEELQPLLKPLYLKAGEAVIFDQSIIHYSPPNLSDNERPVINTFVAHKDARIKICYWDQDEFGEKVEIFEQEDDFLEKFENFGHNIFNRPGIGKSLGLFDYNFPKLNMEMVYDELGLSKNREKSSLISRIKKMFK